MLLAPSLRTRPPPADTRRACCHVLSSFQRTGLARPPFVGLATRERRTFQTYQPTIRVSSPNFGFPSLPGHGGELPVAVRRDIHTQARDGPEAASRRQPCQLPKHGAWRFLELEGRDARRPLSTWEPVRLSLRARHLAASLTNIRSCDGGVNRVSQKSFDGPGRPRESADGQGVVPNGPVSLPATRPVSEAPPHLAA